MKRTTLIFLVLLIAMSLSAEVVVTYTPSTSLEFTRSLTPPLYSDERMVLYLGSLTFTSTDGKLFDPTLFAINTGIHFTFQGQIYNNTNSQPLYFRMASNYEMKGATQWKWLDSGNYDNSLTYETRGNINTNPFTVDLYIVSEIPAVHITGLYYEFINGSFGDFQIATALNSSGHYQGYEYIPVEDPSTDYPPGSPVPFLVGGVTAPPPLYYDNPLVTQTQYLLSIVDAPAFSIQDAYLQDSVKVAEARLGLQDAEPSMTYGVVLVFSNRTNSQDFRLYLDGVVGNYSIPYTLRFNGDQVWGGQEIPWENLSTSQTNYKDIFLSGIDPITAENAPAGEYSDTITVQITPVDH